MNAAEQIAKWEQYKDVAYNFVCGLLECKRAEIERLSLERLTAGFTVYGDASWRKDVDTLEREVMEELADAITWNVMEIDAYHRANAAKK